MSTIHMQLIVILAVAGAAALGATAVGLFARSLDRVHPKWSGGRLAWGVLDASIVAVMSPMIGLIGMVFLATLAPVLFFMIPFFVVWGVQTHEERKHQIEERWSRLAAA